MTTLSLLERTLPLPAWWWMSSQTEWAIARSSQVGRSALGSSLPLRFRRKAGFSWLNHIKRRGAPGVKGL